MKKIFFKLNSKQKQSGIALIFALAMLSLLLIMAIGFATSSIFEQKAAYNSSNTTSARLLCQTATTRVLYLLYQQISLYGETLDYSYDNWTVNKGDKDMLDHLSSNISNVPIYTYNTSHPVTWEYIKTNDGTTDRLIGRFAYVVIPIGGIDPSAVVKSGTREEAPISATVTERRVGSSVDEINIMAVSPADIVASASPGANQVSAGKFNYAATAGSTPAGTLPATGLWTSTANMFTLAGITSGTLKSKLMKWFIIDPPTPTNEYYWVDKDGNGFLNHVPATNDEKYYRFNLARTAAQWNAITNLTLADKVMYSTILLDSTGDGVPETLPTPLPATPAASDGTGIPWLAFFGYKADGTLDLTQGATFGATAAGVAARRRQIAANLVQYCRADTTPLTDIAVANWGTYSATNAYDPTYTGNRNSPYINEVGVFASATVTRAKSATSATVAVSANLFVELIDMYVRASALACNTTVLYKYSFKVYQNGTLMDTVSVPASNYTSLAFNITAAQWASPWRYSNKPEIALTGWSKSYTGLGTANATFSVTDFKFEIDKAVYTNYDCAKIKSVSSPSTTTSMWTMLNNVNVTYSTSTAFTATGQMHLSFQTNDPRQNLNPGDWCVTETAPTGMNGTQKIAPVTPAISDPALVWTNGAINKFNGVLVDPASTGKDLETVHDPAYNTATGAHLSTAYIRNAPMISPWELGQIHRGTAWETINLKEYDPNKAYKYVAVNIPDATYSYARIPGGGAYSDPVNGGGDANILNQVKMIGTAVANKKINLNSAYVDASTGKNITLQALLANIRVGNNPESLSIAAGDTEGSKITAPSTGIDKVVSGIMNKQRGMDYLTRAEVANAMYCTAPGIFKRALSEGVCEITQDTDAKQEELIGKFINLTDVGGKNNYFYVIVVAQAIKDVGGPTGAGINITKIKMNGSTRIVSQITCQLGIFDYDSTNNLYFDEITGEQKVRLLVFADPSDSNKCKILSYEFIE